MHRHTLGPWHVEMDGEDVIGIYADETRIVETDAGVYPPSLPDALLISAAPELLGGCKAALGAFENNNAIDWNDLVRAIAKAEGRS